MDPPGDASGNNTATIDPVNVMEASQNTEQEPNAFVEQSTVTTSNHTENKKNGSRWIRDLQCGSILNQC